MSMFMSKKATATETQQEDEEGFATGMFAVFC